MQEETRSTGANKQVAGYIVPLAYATLLLATAWARRGGLNPGALWFDDVWVAVLTKSSSIFSLAAVPTSEPLGFVAALWIARRVISDPEVSLQVVPFLCGLAAIPLVGMAVAKVTDTSTRCVFAPRPCDVPSVRSASATAIRWRLAM